MRLGFAGLSLCRSIPAAAGLATLARRAAGMIYSGVGRGEDRS
jgi:hypothetical protein